MPHLGAHLQGGEEGPLSKTIRDLKKKDAPIIGKTIESITLRAFPPPPTAACSAFLPQDAAASGKIAAADSSFSSYCSPLPPRLFAFPLESV